MSFELIILGSSSALPTSKRFTTAHLLNINERFFLIDCGEGTQIQLRKNKFSPARINHIFISHLHGDHVFGLFGLLSSMGMMGRKADLNIVGPPSLQKMLESHLEFFGPLSFDLKYTVAADNLVVFQDSKLEVMAIKLRHRLETYGYLFKEKAKKQNVIKDKIEIYNLGVEDVKKIKQGNDFILDDGRVIPNHELTLPPWHRRSYAYISDTAYMPKLVEKISGIDLLYHEATFQESDKKLAKQTSHSTAGQAATIAKNANVGKLLIGHFSTRYKNEALFYDEAVSVFPNTVAVNDGDRFELLPSRKKA